MNSNTIRDSTALNLTIQLCLSLDGSIYATEELPLPPEQQEESVFVFSGSYL